MRQKSSDCNVTLKIITLNLPLFLYFKNRQCSLSCTGIRSRCQRFRQKGQAATRGWLLAVFLNKFIIVCVTHNDNSVVPTRTRKGHAITVHRPTHPYHVIRKAILPLLCVHNPWWCRNVLPLSF